MKSSHQKLSYNGDDSKTDSFRSDAKNDEEKHRMEGKVSPVAGDGRENVRGFKEEVDNFQVMYHRTNKLNNKLIILFSFGRRYCSKIIIVYIAFIIDITLTFRFSVIPNIKINIINYIALSIALYCITTLDCIILQPLGI